MMPADDQNTPADEAKVVPQVRTQIPAMTPAESDLINQVLAQLQACTGYTLPYPTPAAASGIDFWRAVSDLLAELQRYRSQAAQLPFQTAVLQQISDAVIAIDKDQRIIWLNAAAAACYEIDPIAAIGQPLTALYQYQWLSPEDEAAAYTALDQIGRWQGENIHLRPNGSQLYVESTVTVLTDETGATTGLLAVIRDISERKAAEVALWQNAQVQTLPAQAASASNNLVLAESSIDLQPMADIMPAMFWLTDETGACTFLSRGWYEFTAQTEATGLGYGWIEAIHPEDKAQTREKYLAANVTPVPFSLDYRLQHANGSYRWVVDIGHPRFSDDGTFLGYSGSIIDITERKLVEEKLRRSEERYRYLFDAMDEGFCIIEMIFDEAERPINYRFLEINPAFERFTDLHEAIGRTALELVPNLETHWFEIYGNVVSTGEPIRFEQGSVAMNRWFDVYAFRLGDKKNNRVAILFKDVTERKRADEQLHLLNTTLEQRVQERTAQLERSNLELDQFVYIASHDLKAPLRGIDHLANWLAEDVADLLPNSSKEHLAKLRRRVQRMERLLDDLLAYSRVGRRDGTPEVIKPALLVREIVAFLAPPPQFTVDVTDDLPDLLTPRAPLESVLRNLIDNAFKHHHQPEAGVISISAQALDDLVEFCVRDNGPGIDPQFHERIFGVFQMLQPRDQLEGSGMGLALVKKTVEYRGGTVRIESVINQGTAFYFTWPKLTSSE